MTRPLEGDATQTVPSRFDAVLSLILIVVGVALLCTSVGFAFGWAYAGIVAGTLTAGAGVLFGLNS